MNGTPDPSGAPTPVPTDTPSLFQKVELTAGEALGIVRTFLPYVEAAVPQVAAAAGPIGAGISGASLLLGLIAKIPTGPEFTVADQAALAARVAPGQLLDFSSPEWQKALV